MSETGPYGTTEHVGREGPVTANQLVGERAGMITVNAATTGTAPAMFSTAPYKPPPPPHARAGKGPGICLYEDCGGWSKKGSPWCRWHQPTGPT